MDGLLAIVTSIAHRCKAEHSNELLSRSDSIVTEELQSSNSHTESPAKTAMELRHMKELKVLTNRGSILCARLI